VHCGDVGCWEREYIVNNQVVLTTVFALRQIVSGNEKEKIDAERRGGDHMAMKLSVPR